MKLFSQKILRVILPDTRYHHSSTGEITKGSINESLAYPRDIFRPVIGRSAYAFVLVHNHPSGEPAPSEADIAGIDISDWIDTLFDFRTDASGNLGSQRSSQWSTRSSPPSRGDLVVDHGW